MPMDSPTAARFFRQLFTYTRLRPACHSHPLPLTVRRNAGTYSKLKRNAELKADRGILGPTPWITRNSPELNTWKPRKDLVLAERRAEYDEYSLSTPEQLKAKPRRPRRTKILMRDFIEDSLYNPHYGYFTKQAVIFDPGTPFDFNAMRDEAEFYNALSARYTAFEDALDAVEPSDTRQLWHTPTELFRPHYAEAMARYLVENYKLMLYPYHDLIIYELGAGNGTFMLNVLDYIREFAPDVYQRTRYKIIEISPALAEIQRKRLLAQDEASAARITNTPSEPTNDVSGTADPTAVDPAAARHASRVEIINKSIFDWDVFVRDPVFVVALEVIDNFAHDCLRWGLDTHRPHQSVVLVDQAGDFYEYFDPALDPVASRFVRVRDAACEDLPGYAHPLAHKRGRRTYNNPLSRLLEPLRAMRRPSPLAGVPEAISIEGEPLSEPEYVPTRLMGFFDVLQRWFPAHRLVLSDFDRLPQATPGFNAPVVQTRYKRRTVPVGSPLVKQGYFDIFFPTDFVVAEKLYNAITGRLTRSATHEQFMSRWAYTAETETRSGENPLVGWYQNAMVLTTV